MRRNRRKGTLCCLSYYGEDGGWIYGQDVWLGGWDCPFSVHFPHVIIGLKANIYHLLALIIPIKGLASKQTLFPPFQLNNQNNNEKKVLRLQENAHTKVAVLFFPHNSQQIKINPNLSIISPPQPIKTSIRLFSTSNSSSNQSILQKSHLMIAEKRLKWWFFQNNLLIDKSLTK